MYLVIYRHEDEVTLTTMTEKELHKELNQSQTRAGILYGLEFVDSSTTIKKLDLDHFPAHTVLITKSDIVVPRPKKIVQEWSL